jgi:hypothetical protein
MIDNGAERRNFARERTNLPVTVRSGMRQVKAKVEYLGFGGAFVSVSKTCRQCCGTRNRPSRSAGLFVLPPGLGPQEQGHGSQFFDLPSASD